jgi:hypothetical protein
MEVILQKRFKTKLLGGVIKPTIKQMIKNQVEPMSSISGQVHTTNDYFLFKSIDGNRNKCLPHINRLKKSMESSYLFTVIIVNENYEIIDGQHRFDVIEEMKLPLHYIICKGYGLKEVHILNQNSKTWNADDYLTGYCNLGYEDYLLYEEFKNRYKFGHSECITILTNVTSRGGSMGVFYEGNLKISNYLKSCIVADKIEAIGKFYDGYKRRSFVYAMIHLFKNKSFEYMEFITKLKSQPLSLVDCTNATSYVDLIEEIYNYRRRDKVNLRF